MVNKIVVLLILILINIFSTIVKGQQAYEKEWQHLDLENDNVLGVSSYKAYKELTKNKRSSKIIVAIIDGGVDINHPDFKDKIWINKKETPNNNKDDDKNGYIDDINGWNFLANSKGSFQYDNFDIVRELRTEMAKDVYSAKTASLKIEINNRLQLVKAKSKIITNDLAVLDKINRAVSTNAPTVVNLRSYRYQTFEEEQMLIKLVNHFKNDPDLESFKNKLVLELKNLNEQLSFGLNINYDPRSTDSTMKTVMGNNDVIGPLAYHATHVTGLACGPAKGYEKILRNLKLMILRVVPSGDYLDKDMASAIVYAVNNGAKIINISITKRTILNPSILDDAIKYATKHDVLIIHACGNQGQYLTKGLYPSRDYQAGGTSSNWIEVGASDKDANKNVLYLASNYGKSIVDVYAPGVNLYSAIPGNLHAYLSGTSMATPIVSHVAAILRSSFPHLKASQIKELIMKSVTKLNQSVVTLNGDSIPFSDCSSSGGIVNLYRAMLLANQIR